MDKYIGKTLDNRYEIIEVIGVGGMSVVYKARCNRLNRYVALKVLKDEYSADESLRRQFHDESQSVAILSHPNIVSVYDVSHFEDTEYIVMELIDGITLKEYLKRRGVLTWKEVTFFALQIAKALEHAHSRNIIHRDIKPQNIMLLRDGTLKVADFGIAKNMVAQEGTKTMGEAIGSVHYVSPEQAKGSIIDARSDLYSFGVVMYEMLTGRLPFEGDSPVSIAIQHINSMALPPSDFVDGIPQTLESITMKAMNPSLARRYGSATDILRDLESFRSNPNFILPVDPTQTNVAVDKNTAEDKSDNSAEKPIEDNMLKYIPKPTTSQSDSKRVPTQNNRVIKKPAPAPSKRLVKKPVHKTGQRKPVRPDEGKNASVKKSVKKGKLKSKKTYNTKVKNIGWAGFSGAIVFALIAILLFLLGVAFFVYKVINPFGTTESNKVTVPDLVGKNYEVVVGSLEYAEYNIVKGESIYDSEYEAGFIISQSIKPNRRVNKDTEIEVTVSLGNRSIVLEDYSGKDYIEVQNDLRSHDIATVVESDYSNIYDVGQVIETRPAAGETVSKSQSVTIIYSKGPKPEQTIVPNILSMNEHQAKDAITNAGLVVGTPEYVENEATPGTIIYQTISADSIVDKGIVLSYIVSTGIGGGTLPPVEVGYGVSYDPYPDDIAKRTMDYKVDIIEAEGEISVTVKVNSYLEYEGTHYYSEGSITVPLTAFYGYNTVTVIQNGTVIQQRNVVFE